jgi:hypothetical protein
MGQRARAVVSLVSPNSGGRPGTNQSHLGDLNPRPAVYEAGLSELGTRIEPETRRLVRREVTRTNGPDERCPPDGRSLGADAHPGDPLERALLLAAEAGRFDVVASLAGELQARRLATEPNVVAMTPTRRGRP